MQYEFACGRSMLFSERYLSVPIANALYSICVFRSIVTGDFAKA